MVIRSIEDNATRNNDIDGKVIRNARLARQILAEGGKDVWLFDVKPDRTNRERSCFVFENNDKFQEVFSRVIEHNRKEREARDSQSNKELRDELEDLKKKFAELTKATTETKE